MQTTTLNLNELKKLVAEAKDLSQPFSYFLDITEKTDAVRTHKAIYQPEQHSVINLIIKIIENTIHQTINLTSSMFLEVPEHSFFHGTCQAENNVFPITVIYFSDIQTGIIASIAENLSTNFFRFSLAVQPDAGIVH